MDDLEISQEVRDAFEAEQFARDKVLIVRNKIHENAGDTQSLLGTTADGTQLALYMLAELMDAIHTSATLDDLKVKLEPRLVIAQAHLASVADGTTTPTFLLKGVDAVIEDVQTRATAVSNVLKDAGQ